MSIKLAIIQRTGIITDNEWRDLDGASKLLKQLSDAKIDSILIWRGSTNKKNIRIEDVFKPFSKLAARSKSHDVQLMGAVFIDDDSNQESSKLEPNGTALSNAIEQYQLKADELVMIARDYEYISAANHLDIKVVAPDSVADFLLEIGEEF